jgi:membrane-bound lytic murein transglycosylase MltF
MVASARLAIVLTFTVIAAACGDGAPNSATTTEPPAAGPTINARSPAPAAQDTATPPETEDPWLQVADLPQTNVFGETWTGDLEALSNRRLIRVLTVYSVGRYYLHDGQEKGFTYELMKLFERFVNSKQVRGHLKVNVVFVPVARNQLIPALLDGRGDIISAGLSITPERREQVDFTIPVSKPLEEILVTGPKAPPIETIDDLSGKTLYVRHSSSYRESVEQLNQRFGDAGKPPVTIELVSELLEDDDLIEMVAGGLLPWAIVDSYKTQLWDGVFDDLVVRNDIVFNSGTELAWAIRQGSPELLRLSNEFLKKHREGTLTGNVLANRYIRDFDWAAHALEKADYERFKELEAIFRTYGDQYGFDHLMLAAQGYQESRLDQNVRSRAGAVGVMQVLPSTARDPNVNIDNIREVDNNIHAGTKYMDFLRNRYFSEPAIEENDRNWLALAAYNAGPSRMINLRNKAAKLGYDPNRWFDNVEVVAAKDIGQETVQYVSNIFKYHISYRLSLEQESYRQAARARVGIEPETTSK